MRAGLAERFLFGGSLLAACVCTGAACLWIDGLAVVAVAVAVVLASLVLELFFQFALVVVLNGLIHSY